MTTKKSFLFEHNQHFWQLAFIQGAALGIPGIFIGNQFAKMYGPASAVISICIGNIVLWAISFAIVGMSLEGRKNAIQNIKNYLGQIGEWCAIFVFAIQFLIWFAIQLQFATQILAFSPLLMNWSFSQAQIGAFLGVVIALISMGGIRTIKWLCLFAFPLILLYVIYLIPFVGRIHYAANHWVPSFSIIFVVVSLGLPGAVNLPTFFRHALSKNHSVFGLFTMILLVTLIECLTVFIDFDVSSQLFGPYFINHFHSFVTLAFVGISLICANIINVYYISACWEVVFLGKSQGKEYLMIGLAGTLFFAFLQFQYPLDFIGALAGNYTAALGVVLLIDLLIKTVTNHKVRLGSRFASIGCWLLGCIGSSIVLIKHPDNLSYSMMAGIFIVLVSFLIVVFIEETLLSFRLLLKQGKWK